MELVIILAMELVLVMELESAMELDMVMELELPMELELAMELGLWHLVILARYCDLNCLYLFLFYYKYCQNTLYEFLIKF